MQSTPAASRRIAPCSDRVRHIRADKRPRLARRLYHSPRIQSKGGGGAPQPFVRFEARRDFGLDGEETGRICFNPLERDGPRKYGYCLPTEGGVPSPRKLPNLPRSFRRTQFSSTHREENPEFRRLAEKHREYDIKIGEFDRIYYLTSEQERKRKELQKLKLKIKDEMYAIMRQVQHAHQEEAVTS
jgi:uncharacterized protein YdcH (DUF465 family)